MMSSRRILLKLWRRRRLQRDLEAELAFHRDLARQHSNPIGLGNTVRVEEEARDLWRFNLVEDVWRDVCYAVRSLRKAPGFAAIAIATLALGIGANTAIFTLMHRIMLAVLPVREPSQLVEVLIDRGAQIGTAFSYEALRTFRGCTKTCSEIIYFANITFHGVIDGRPMERLSGQFVPGGHFSALGITALLGRPITREDDRRGAETNVAVISHSMWQNRFGGVPEVIGKTINLENVPFTIIGVAPASFRGLDVGRLNDVWIPLESEPAIRRPSYTSSPAYKWLQVVARLKSGIALDEARTELSILYSKALDAEVEALKQEFRAENRLAEASQLQVRRESLLLEPAAAGMSRTRRDFSRPLQALMAIVAVLLLIACANVANLLFSRAIAREKEIALRMSLGAGRRRLIRQLLTESAVLVTGGGTLGFLAAHFLSRYLVAFLANSNAPVVLEISPNMATLGFTSAIAILTVLLFGLMPALRSTDMDFASAMKGTNSGGRGRPGNRWGSGLIVVQVALLMILVVGAGLFLRTLRNLNSADLGFNRSNVLLVNVDPFGSGHSLDELKSLSQESLVRIEALPGVQTAAVSRYLPITGGAGTNLTFLMRREGGREVAARSTWVNYVGPQYFTTLDVPILAGREFSRGESMTGIRPVIVNQTFARRYFGNMPPIGKTMTQREIPLEIIGVVADSKYAGIRSGEEPTVYYNVFHQWGVPIQFLIRSEREPQTIAGAVRAELTSAIGNVLIRERTLEDHVEASIVRERLVTNLAAIFGGLALVLAVIGLYGVVSNNVARRTKEIGIRIALGFDQRSAVAMVLREVFVLAGAGIVLGLPLAILVTRSAETLLYGLTPDDPLNVIASVVALLLSAFLAGLVPARRASRVDPAVALRIE